MTFRIDQQTVPLSTGKNVTVICDQDFKCDTGDVYIWARLTICLLIFSLSTVSRKTIFMSSSVVRRGNAASVLKENLDAPPSKFSLKSEILSAVLYI